MTAGRTTAIFNPSPLLAVVGVDVGFALGLLVQAFSSKLVVNQGNVAG
jgi:hypothetical protein